MSEALNMSTSTLSSYSGTGFGWTITIVVFLGILLTLFLLSKKFRMFVYGLIVWAVFGLLFLVYTLSRYIGTSAETGDFEPLKWIIGTITFILLSILFGKLLLKIPKFREFDEEMRK